MDNANTTKATGKSILVSDPDRHGESQSAIYCAEHLAASLRLSPLGPFEYVLPASDDADCEECGR